MKGRSFGGFLHLSVFAAMNSKHNDGIHLAATINWRFAGSVHYIRECLG